MSKGKNAFAPILMYSDGLHWVYHFARIILILKTEYAPGLLSVYTTHKGILGHACG